MDAPELKSSVWNMCHSVKCHFLKSKIVSLLPDGCPASHSRWQFFLSRVADITNPHIDSPTIWVKTSWEVYPKEKEEEAEEEVGAF